MDSCWWLSLLVFLVLNYGMTMTMGSDLGMRDYGMDGFCLWHAEHYYLAALQRWKKNCFVPSRPLLGDGKWWKNCVLIHFLGSNGSKNMCLMCSVFKGPNIWRWSPFVDFLPGLLRGEKQTCARCVIVSRAQPLGDDHLFSERWPSANVACLTLMMRPTSKTRGDKVPKRKFGF